ncbi:Serine/threonine-protein phosphatase 1 [compost metagenome]
MSRTLVISDIHGCLAQLFELLNAAKYDPLKDKLIFLGDYIDRGTQSKDVVEQVKALTEKYGAVALIGNHDLMMINALNGSDEGDDGLWLNNGGYLTIESYCGLDFFEEGFEWEGYQQAKTFIKNHFSHHIDFIHSLPYYHETENHIFVHAGLNPCYSDDWREQPKEDLVWIRDIFLNNATNLEKTVVFGHTPTLNLHGSADIWFKKDKIGIDGGCVFGLQLNCLVINEDGSYGKYSVPKRMTKSMGF